MRQQTDQGSTIEVMFDLRGSGITYKTAGNLAIYAENSLEDVMKFAELMKYDLEQSFALVANENFSGKKATMPIPFGQYTIKETLTKFVDLTGPLSKKMIKELAKKCENQAEKEE